MSVESSPTVRIAERYSLRERIAVGGMGEVHLATDDRLGRLVAVKVLAAGFADSPDFVERFRREALTAAALSHPNIAQVYDYGVDGDSHFIVMEYAEGQDLAHVIRQHGRLTPGDAVRVAEQVCAALGAAHRAGVVHRDVKPGNVIIRPDGTVKVTDFGIARALGQASLTDTGTVMGTAAYVAPEQARGEADDAVVRPLLARHPALPDADRLGALRRRHPGRDRDAPPRRAGAAAQLARRRPAREPRRGRRPRHGQVTGRPLRRCRRHGCRAGRSRDARRRRHPGPAGRRGDLGARPRRRRRQHGDDADRRCPPGRRAHRRPPAPTAYADATGLGPARPSWAGRHPTLERGEPPPSRPSPVVWVLLVAVVALVGILGYVLLSGSDAPTTAAPGTRPSATSQKPTPHRPRPPRRPTAAPSPAASSASSATPRSTS